MPEASEEVFLLRAVEKPASFNASLGHPVLESAGHYSPLHKEARGHCMRGVAPFCQDQPMFRIQSQLPDNPCGG